MSKNKKYKKNKLIYNVAYLYILYIFIEQPITLTFGNKSVNV